MARFDRIEAAPHELLREWIDRYWIVRFQTDTSPSGGMTLSTAMTRPPRYRRSHTFLRIVAHDESSQSCRISFSTYASAGGTSLNMSPRS